MATRFISLPDDLNIKLKDEKNASALIASLLRNHYNLTGATEEDLINKREQLTKKLDEVLDEKSKGLVLIEKQIEKIQTIEAKKAETLADMIKRQQQRIVNIIENARDIFNATVTDKQAEEYLENQDSKTLLDFLIDKGLAKRESEIEDAQ
jgi:hypothetical protein